VRRSHARAIRGRVIVSETRGIPRGRVSVLFERRIDAICDTSNGEITISTRRANYRNQRRVGRNDRSIVTQEKIQLRTSLFSLTITCDEHRAKIVLKKILSYDVALSCKRGPSSVD